MQTKLRSLLAVGLLLVSFSAAKAQSAYWTENFESNKIPGKSAEALTSPTDVDPGTGNWNMYFVFRGSAACDGKALRLMKNSSSGLEGTSFAITPSLKSGVSKLTFIETQGGASKKVGVYKSSDNGKTWSLVETVAIGAAPCTTYTVEVNDKAVNKLKFTNESNSDVNFDVLTVYKYEAK